APLAAAGEHHARARVREVGDEVASVEDLRPDGDGHLDRLAVGAVAAAAAAVPAPARGDPAAAPERGEVAERGVGDQRDVAAPPAVAAVGAALRDVLLAPEREPAVS